MKRYAPFIACAAGIILLWILVPRFNSSQPRGIRLTRAEAKAIADREARRAGIPVDQSWSILTWDGSALLDKELDADPSRRRLAASDPVIGPRLGAYKATYFRRRLDKFQSFGEIEISAVTGDVLMRRVRLLTEEPGARLEEASIRARADAFVRSRELPGAPNPEFEDARPNRLRNRTDWTVRYRIPSKFNTGTVVPYLYVVFIGDKLGGWALIEEYADGRNFRGENQVLGFFVRYGVMYTLLLILLVIFLKKYHAGEVGVGTGSLLFALTVVVSLIFDAVIGPSASESTGLGTGVDAQQTAIAQMGFKFLFFDLPSAVLIFFAWAVGESYARERWGERLASFDALLRRDPLNATSGRSVLYGLLTAPAVATAAYLAALIPLMLHRAHPTIGATEVLASLGGPSVIVLACLLDAIAYAVVGILFILAAANRRRLLTAGIALALLFACVNGMVEAPIAPFFYRLLFAFGAPAAAIAIFLAYDLLTTAIALIGASLLALMLPYLSVAQGNAFQQAVLWIFVPMAFLLAYAVAALMTKREVVYTYEDLAPHVKRIVERERVKAEIDAANRIQAALLPLDTPNLAGASVASHYRAATEIGGDYFDFLPQKNGEIGIAFGDVSGHGLTSGIVMAMAKSALMVQVDHDASPRAVMNMLNDIVIRTAPKRILMTFFFGVLDPRSQTLRFSSAGHLDPYVYRANPRKLEPLSSWGFPLGVRRREPFREHTVEFSAGDRLILYSDGLIEAVDDDGDPFGFDRFEKTLIDHGHLSADEIKKTLLNAVRKFTRNRPPEDDQTLVVVSFDEAVREVVAPRAVAVGGYADSVN